METRITFAFMIALGAAPSWPLDIAGHVVDKRGGPVAQVMVCFESDPGKCAASAADGSFHLSDATAADRSLPEARGFAASLRGSRLSLQSPAAATVSLQWLDARGRAVSSALSAALAAGPNEIAFPRIPDGFGFLRLTSGNLSVTWKAALGNLGNRARGEGASTAVTEALAKAAAAPVVDPAGVGITAAKPGVHATTYYPAAMTETNAKVVVALDGDEVLFDGKSMDLWTGKPGDWTIANNALHGQGSAGQIFSKGDYGTFRLFVTSRVVAPDSNNGDDHLGILFWGKRPAAGSYGANGIQVQPPNGFMWSYGAGANPSPKRLVPNPNWRYHLWHTSELLVNLQTGRMRYAVFGTEITQWTGNAGSFKAGPIGVQIHKPTSTVEYKDIWVDPNPDKDAMISARN
jgi:hypothetical protein